MPRQRDLRSADSCVPIRGPAAQPKVPPTFQDGTAATQADSSPGRQQGACFEGGTLSFRSRNVHPNDECAASCHPTRVLVASCDMFERCRTRAAMDQRHRRARRMLAVEAMRDVARVRIPLPSRLLTGGEQVRSLLRKLLESEPHSARPLSRWGRSNSRYEWLSDRMAARVVTLSRALRDTSSSAWFLGGAGRSVAFYELALGSGVADGHETTDRPVQHEHHRNRQAPQ